MQTITTEQVELLNLLIVFTQHSNQDSTTGADAQGKLTGTLKVQASLNPTIQTVNDTDYITLSTESYTSQSNPAIINWNGVYSAIRFVKTTTTGTLSQVLYRP